ncbi:MAG: methionyl-tRNA formyltransferase [bacterium]
MNKIKIIFFGTHEFASVILKGLIEDPLIDIKKVVTQPDRPAGRKKNLQKTPVKILSEKYGLIVDQPDKLKNYNLDNADLNIVADYGMIIPQKILDAPKHGSINVHPSLLPKYRGPSPIQTALLNGETESGVSIMLMDDKMDHGPILAQQSLVIEADDTYPLLSKKMAEKAIKMLLPVISKWINGEIQVKVQDDAQASLCHMLSRDHGQVDFNRSAQEIYNQYRALLPWPGIWTELDGKRLKLLKIRIADKNIKQGEFDFTDGHFYIGCNSNSIEILELQPEGKKSMTAKNFINGYQQK